MTVDRFLLLLTLAALVYRLSRLVARDDITAPLRQWLWTRAYAEGSEWDEDGRMRYVRRSRVWWTLYSIADCPFCNSPYIAALCWWAWFGWPFASYVRPAMELGAVMGMAAFIASRKDA